MHAAGEALLFVEAGEQLGEGGPVRIVECLREVVVVGAGKVDDPTHGRVPFGGEVQGVLPAVGGAARPLDETARFEIVDQGHYLAGPQPEPRGYPLLAATRFIGDRAQDTDQGRREPDLGHPPDESVGSVRTELRQQERNPRPVPGTVRFVGHLGLFPAVTMPSCQRRTISTLNGLKIQRRGYGS